MPTATKTTATATKSSAKSKSKAKTNTGNIAFTVEAKTLQDEIATLKRIAPNRPSHPILACFLFEATADELLITASDLSQWLQIRIKDGYQGHVTEKLAFCVNAAYFSTLLNSLKGELSVEHLGDQNQIQIKTSSGKHKVAIASPAEYPEFGMADNRKSQRQESEIPASWLAGLRRVRPYASDDESKQVLCGVKLTGLPAGLELAATNGHYLARYRVIEPATGEVAGFEANIPGSSIDALPRIESSNTAYMRIEPGMIEFSADNWVFRTRLNEGQYPNYPQLIPAQFEKKCVMPLEELRDRLEPVKICALMKNKVMAIVFKGDRVYLTAEAPEVGKVQECLANSANTAPDDFLVGFDSTYVAIALKSFSCDEIELNMNSQTSPVVFCAADSGDLGDTLEVLIMPVGFRDGTDESYKPTLE